MSLEITPGETLGLVGETGCGKSTLARCMTRLYDLTGGKVFFDGQDISELSRRQLRPVRREIQMIFQDPYGSLNPRRRVGSIIGDAFSIHGIDSKKGNKRSVQELMELVGLNPEHYNRFPAEFSGGQRQRIGVARALALKPKMIVCDEPVSALDVSIQAQVINLLKDLQAEFGLTYVFISHDLSVVRHVSDRIAVMYLGKVIEISEAARMFDTSRHPYTRALLSALPPADPDAADRRERIVLSGDLPSPLNPPTGCRFHPRCPKATDKCVTDVPVDEPAFDDPPEHPVACWHPMTRGGEPQRLHARDHRHRRRAGPSRSRDCPGGHSDRRGHLMSIGRLTPEQRPHQAPDRRHHVPRAGRSAEPIQGRSPWALVMAPASQGQGRDDLARVIGLVVLLAIIAPLIAHWTGHGVNTQYRDSGALDENGLPVGPSSRFLFGTDPLGRDVLVRTAYGARISLLVGVTATLLTVVLGVTVGLVSGYFGGWVDTTPGSPHRRDPVGPVHPGGRRARLGVQPEPADRHPGHRVLQLGLGGPRRPRAGALAQGA